MDFWRRAASVSSQLQVSGQRKNGSNTILGRLVKNILRWNGHVVRMGDKKWPRKIMTWSPEGSRGRGLPEMKCEKEVELELKKRNLTSGDTVNWQLWRLKPGTGGQLENRQAGREAARQT